MKKKGGNPPFFFISRLNYLLFLLFISSYAWICFFNRRSAFLSCTTNIAWITPGTQKNNVNMKLIIAWNGFPQNNTATGGRRIANKYIISW